MFGESHGLYGVVTGLFGLDAEHGGQTELHPIFSMAVRTKRTVNHTASGEKIEDHWAFFLRNYGNEGGCASTGLHMWVSPTGEYFVQMPKPQGVTALNQLTDGQGWAWDKGNTSTLSFVQSTDWVVVKVRPRDPWSPFGVDGEFTAVYTVPAGKKQKEAPPPEGNPKVRQESEGTDLGAKIADPAVKAKFQAAMNTLQPAPPKEKVQITVSPKVAVAQKAPGAASKGQMTRTRVVEDPVRQQREAQMLQILRTYQQDLKVEVPANPTSKATIVRSKPMNIPTTSAPETQPPK